MSGPLHVVVRADASSIIGGGHVMRCLALAAALSDDGWIVTFASSRQTVVTFPAIGQAGYRCVTLADPLNPQDLIAALPEGCDLLVIDHYGIDQHYEKACRAWAKSILAVDDLANRDHDCDLLLDQTLDRLASAYAGRVPADCRMLLGSNYVLLRPSFARARRNRTLRHDVRRLLVAMGSYDTGNNLVPLINALTKIPVGLDIAVGSAAPNIDAIKTAAQSTGASLHIDADMERLMVEADLAVLAAGTTTWEAACVGLPMILIVTADNQIGVADAMVAAKAAIVARTPNEVAAQAAMLIGDRKLRRSLANSTLAICDGYGANRVAICLRPERIKDGTQITLRPVRREDADLMLAWQCHPQTWKFACNPAVPTEGEYRQWFDRKLADPLCIFSLILCDSEPVCVLRLDRSDRGLEISILTAPGRTRRGVALAAVRLARRLVGHECLLAQVLEGSRASQRLFEQAGFETIGRGWFKQEPALRAAVA